MEKAFSDVLQHQRTFCPHYVGSVPAVPQYHIEEHLRHQLSDAHQDLRRAMANDDVAGVAEHVCGLIHSALCVAVAYGLDVPPLWEVTTTARLSGMEDPRPTLERILSAQGPIG